jgi:hypothetical protein
MSGRGVRLFPNLAGVPYHSPARQLTHKGKSPMKVYVSRIWSQLQMAKADLEKAIESAGVPSLRIDGLEYTPDQLAEIVRESRSVDLPLLKRTSDAWMRVFDALSALVPGWWRDSKNAPAVDEFIATLNEMHIKARQYESRLEQAAEKLCLFANVYGRDEALNVLRRFTPWLDARLSAVPAERLGEFVAALDTRTKELEAVKAPSREEYWQKLLRFSVDYGRKEKRAALQVFDAKCYADIPAEKRRQFLDYIRERGEALDREAGRTA